MAEEKIITVNLKKKILIRPRWRRERDAVRVLKEILKRQTKKEIKLDKKLNEKIFSGETKLRLKLINVDDKVTRVELME